MLTKGYYYTESKMVKLIKDHVLKSKNRGKFKTIECQIMDIADDIAYSTYDLEDALKAEFLKPLDLISAPPSIVKIVAQKVGLYSKGKEKIRKIINEIFFDYFERPYKIEDKSQITLKAIDDLYFFSIRFANEQSQDIATNSYVRTDLTSKLVGHFIRNVHIDKIDSKNPALSVVKLKNDIRIKVEVLKHLIYELQIKSPKLKVVAYRSKEIIGTIFSVLIAKGGHELLPKDFRISYDLAKDVRAKRRVVCDFIAGMTDRYALEFYGRLKSENPQTIFKPI
jgi:dGTPase